MTPHIIQSQAAQGDLLITRIERLPTGVRVLLSSVEVIVAHSETGHHHVAIGEAFRYLVPEDTGPEAGLVAYLEVLRDHVDVVHRRDWDTHEPYRLGPGIYQLDRQREARPEGWARVED